MGGRGREQGGGQPASVGSARSLSGSVEGSGPAAPMVSADSSGSCASEGASPSRQKGSPLQRRKGPLCMQPSSRALPPRFLAALHPWACGSREPSLPGPVPPAVHSAPHGLRPSPGSGGLRPAQNQGESRAGGPLRGSGSISGQMRFLRGRPVEAEGAPGRVGRGAWARVASEGCPGVSPPWVQRPTSL